MDNSQENRVRQYTKSSVPRLRWTPELHDHFVKVVHNLGGKYQATPKKILQMMAVKGLKISQVKSHLQMYRSMKDLKGLIAIKKYQDQKPDCTSWLPQRKFSQVIGQFDYSTRRQIVQNCENVFYHENRVEGTGGSITNILSEGRDEISKADMGRPINLDLTMSLH